MPSAIRSRMNARSWSATGGGGDVERRAALDAHHLVLDVGQRGLRLGRRGQRRGSARARRAASCALLEQRRPGARRATPGRPGRGAARRSGPRGRSGTSRDSALTPNSRTYSRSRSRRLGNVMSLLAQEAQRVARSRPACRCRAPSPPSRGDPLVRALEQRHLGLARLAPRGPHVQHDDLARVVGQRSGAVGAEHRQVLDRRLDPLAVAPAARRARCPGRSTRRRR